MHETGHWTIGLKKAGIFKFVLTIGLGLMLSQVTFGQGKVKLGDKVQFEHRGETYSGIVEHTSLPGKFMVRYTKPGDPVENTHVKFLKPDEMTKLADSPNSNSLNSNPGGGRRGNARGHQNAVVQNSNPFRKWKAANGKREFDARFVEVKGAKIVLELQDGTTVEEETAQLSSEDNLYVVNFVKNDLTRRKIRDRASVPFVSNRRSLKATGWKFVPDDQSPSFELPEVSLRLETPVGFGSGGRRSWSGGGAGRPGPGRRSSRFSSRFGGNNGVPVGNGGFTRPKVLDYDFSQWVMAGDGERCFLLANSNFDQGCVIQGLNFATGEIEFNEEIDGQGLGISTDGKLVAFLQTSRQGDVRGEMIIKEVGKEGNVIERFPVKSFMDDSGFGPRGGYFMNQSILATVGTRIVATDVQRKSGYCTTNFPKNVGLQETAISPNRKILAMESPGGIFLFDVSKAKPVGTILFDGFESGKIAFSNDGTKLSHVSLQSGIKTYDLKTGNLLKQHPADGTFFSKTLSWPHPRFLLFDEKVLFDLELGVVVWRFQHIGNIFNPMFHLGGSTFLAHGNGGMLTPVTLPLERIEKSLKGISIEDSTVLKKGDDFSIEMDLPFGAGDNAKIQDRFQLQLEARGIKYNENSSNVFRCVVEYGEPDTAIINMSRTDEEKTVTVNFTPSKSIVQLLIDGDVQWQRVRKNQFTGGTLVGDGSETPQQAANRICNPNVSHFSGMRFPGRFMLFPNGKDIMGESRVSQDGVKDIDY